MERFVLDFEAEAGGTYKVGQLTTHYQNLEKLFGEPIEADNYKVSGEWVFKDSVTGAVFTVYDWKETNLYDSELPSVESFRTAAHAHTFSVGGCTNPADFIAWIRGKLSTL